MREKKLDLLMLWCMAFIAVQGNICIYAALITASIGSLDWATAFFMIAVGIAGLWDMWWVLHKETRVQLWREQSERNLKIQFIVVQVALALYMALPLNGPRVILNHIERQKLGFIK